MISIVIILKNDLKVVNTIEGINKLNYRGDAEIIIVDRSTINCPKIESRISLKWIKFDPRGKQYTIPEQRNKGLDEAKGDIIVFIDASCVPEKNWLIELVKPINEEKEKIVMGRTGSIGKATLNDLSHEKLKETMYVNEAPTINLAISKEVFGKIGYFDEKLEYGSDIDLTWRAIDKGFKIRYQPTAYVAHDWGNTKQETKRTILYGKARARLLIKHYRTRWKNLLGNDSPVILYSVLIIGLPIALFFPWYLLLFVLLVVKNIKESNPVGIVVKHIIYGLGVLIEVKNQLLNRYAK